MFCQSKELNSRKISRDGNGVEARSGCGEGSETFGLITQKNRSANLFKRKMAELDTDISIIVLRI